MNLIQRSSLLMAFLVIGHFAHAQVIVSRIDSVSHSNNGYGTICQFKDSLFYQGFSGNDRMLYKSGGSRTSERELLLADKGITYEPRQLTPTRDALFVIGERDGYNAAIFKYQESSGSFIKVTDDLYQLRLFHYQEAQDYLLFYSWVPKGRKIQKLNIPTSTIEELAVVTIESEAQFFDRKFAVSSTHLFFINKYDVHGKEIRAINLKTKNDYLLKDICPFDDPSYYPPEELYVYRDQMFFAAHDGDRYSLWRSDGTTAGTKSVGSHVPKDNLYAPFGLIGVNNQLIYAQRIVDGTNDLGVEYYCHNLDSDTSLILFDIVSNHLGGAVSAGNYSVVADSLLAIPVQRHYGNDSAELWLTNGMLSGTRNWLDLSELGVSESFYVYPARGGYHIGNGRRFFWINVESGLKHPIAGLDDSPVEAVREHALYKDDLILGELNSRRLYRVKVARLKRNHRLTLCAPGDTLAYNTGLPETEVKQVWGSGHTGSAMVFMDTGWYSIEFRHPQTDSLYGRDSLKVVLDPAYSFSLGNDTAVSLPFTIKPGVAGDYFWSDSSTADTFQVTLPGTYSVLYRSPGGCTRVDSIVLNYPLSMDGVLEVEPRVYPNPSAVNGSITIAMDGNTQIENLKLFDMQGRLIAQSNEQGSILRWNPVTKSGIYLLEIKAGNLVHRVKLSRVH